jgi:cell division protein FtsI (penicillin-binding protein 3)
MYKDKSSRSYENEIRTARANGSRYVLIRKKVTNEERKRLGKLPIFNLGRMKGGIIDNQETIIRKAPNGILLRRTLGYYKKEHNLEVGLEGAYHSYLEGEPGKEIEHRITTGWKKTGRFTKDPIEGADIVTTFDKDVQEVAHSELEHQLKEMDAQSGTVILMEVATGHVKAIVNLDREKDGSFSERFNHAVGLREVPGSTMKLASIMAGLEDNKFKITDKVNAVGSYQVYRKTFTDANDGRGYGTITIQQAFEKSSNVIALILYKAYRNDPNLFLQRLGEFGLTEPLGTEIPGELGPKFFNPGSSGWSPYSIPSMAIGYEYQQSPLHTCAFYNAVANNGKFLRPLFVKEIRRAGKIIKRMKPVVIREKICSDATLKIMQNCLKGVMSRGTGKKLTSSQFSIAGKTGTARLLNDKSQYVEENQSDFQASFAGYFPANNPKYTCVVVVTRPKKQKYAALVAGPVFAAIANKIYASNLTYHPAINERKPFAPGLPAVKGGYYRDVTQVLKHLGVRFQLNTSAKWVQADSLNNSIHLNAVQIRKSGVPNVKGMTAKDAVYLLELKGLSVSLKGYGRVVSQSLNPGTEIHKGQLVKLELK